MYQSDAIVKESWKPHHSLDLDHLVLQGIQFYKNYVCRFYKKVCFVSTKLFLFTRRSLLLAGTKFSDFTKIIFELASTNFSVFLKIYKTMQKHDKIPPRSSHKTRKKLV